VSRASKGLTSQCNAMVGRTVALGKFGRIDIHLDLERLFAMKTNCNWSCRMLRRLPSTIRRSAFCTVSCQRGVADGTGGDRKTAGRRRQSGHVSCRDDGMPSRG